MSLSRVNRETSDLSIQCSRHSFRSGLFSAFHYVFPCTHTSPLHEVLASSERIGSWSHGVSLTFFKGPSRKLILYNAIASGSSHGLQLMGRVSPMDKPPQLQVKCTQVSLHVAISRLLGECKTSCAPQSIMGSSGNNASSDSTTLHASIWQYKLAEAPKVFFKKMDFHLMSACLLLKTTHVDSCLRTWCYNKWGKCQLEHKAMTIDRGLLPPRSRFCFLLLLFFCASLLSSYRRDSYKYLSKSHDKTASSQTTASQPEAIVTPNNTGDI